MGRSCWRCLLQIAARSLTGDGNGRQGRASVATNRAPCVADFWSSATRHHNRPTEAKGSRNIGRVCRPPPSSIDKLHDLPHLDQKECQRRTQWSPAAIMNLLTKLEIIGLGVMVMMLLGVAVLMLWRS
jgi:hypothetical protein